MVNAIRHIGNGPVRDWYLTHVDHRTFHDWVTKYNKEGYTLNLENGLMVRKPSDTTTMDRTILDIVFPRPVDLHYHTDVSERLSVVSGKGALIVGNQFGESEERLCPALIIGNEFGESEEKFCSGSKVYIPVNEVHSFRPDKNNFLEIRVECTGILDPTKEVCVQRFYEFRPWVKYFNERLMS
jgi:mannose-6-phosphate isomerase-like protein (cupin superfamily)